MTKDDNYTNVILEDIRSQMQAVLEIAADTQQKVSALPTMQEDIAELKDDVATIKHAIGDISTELQLHDRRITKLEEKIA